MDNLSGLSVFVHAAQTHSFVATARALDLTASAVSKSISRLEARVGVRLFQRSTRSVQLTSEGEVFLERCRRIFGEIQAAEDELANLAHLPRGRLKVSLPYAAGLTLPLLSVFMQHYPEIELDLDFSDRVTDLIEEGFDVVIRGGALQDSRLVSRRLGSYRLCLVGAPAYLARRGAPQQPADLAQHACLHYRYPSSGKLEPWPLRHSRNASDPAGLASNMICSSLEALLYMVQEGHGIACVPDFAVKNALAEGRMVVLLDSYMTRANPFFIVWPSSRQMTPKIRVFIDFVSKHFSHALVRKNTG